jgi:signal transduction histidine kinase
MWDYLTSILNSDMLSPHGICLLWRPELVWLHIVADSLIGLAYFSIPVVLSALVSKRHDIEFVWVFWAFAIFILACGTTHFFSIWTLFIPDYGAEGLVKAATAIASVITAIGLWPLLPKVLALPSPEQLRRANDALKSRIEERDRALHALEHAKEERLRTEDMLRQSQKLEAIGQLTAGIAHDFNNLLTVILGNLDRANRRAADENEVKRAIAAASQSAERAAILTERLLAFGRRQPLDPQKTDVNALVGRSADMFQRTLGERVKVGTRLAADLSATFIDASELENALLNLAINARDAMPDGGCLTLATRNVSASELPVDPPTASESYVEISVADDGHGMTAEVVSRAFEPFFTTKPVGESSGLGLSQVYGFIQQSHGAVSIDSHVGRGTVIRLYLPEWRAPSASEQRDAIAIDLSPDIAAVAAR